MMRGPQVLIIDDDPGVRRLLQRELAAAQYRVRDEAPGPSALQTIAEHPFDLVVLDIDSPAGGGADIIQLVRNVSPVPILALSASSDEDAAVGALDKGADDYVQKPFRVRELLARIENALRRRAREQGKPARLVTGDLEIDLLHRRVRVRGQEVHLAAKPYEVLRILAEGAGKPFSHEELLHTVWRTRPRAPIQLLRFTIGELRRKLETNPVCPRYILTEVNVGYRLNVQQPGATPAASP